MVGSDHPSPPYERSLRAQRELGFKDEVMDCCVELRARLLDIHENRLHQVDAHRMKIGRTNAVRLFKLDMA